MDTIVQNIFAYRYHNAFYTDPLDKLRSAYKDLFELNDVKNFEALERFHNFVLSNKPDYLIKTIENKMVETQKLGSSGKYRNNPPFNVIPAPLDILSYENVRMISCPKIYFYENRDDSYSTIRQDLRSRLCEGVNDPLYLLDYSGSLVDTGPRVEEIYRSLGFKL
jgi:hypothetical protein